MSDNASAQDTNETPADAAEESTALATAGWAAFALFTLLLCLAILAQLPPIN